MPWTALGNSAATWVVSVSTDAPPWAQLSADTTQTDVVNFALRASEQFPMFASSDTIRALSALSSYISGV